MKQQKLDLMVKECFCEYEPYLKCEYQECSECIHEEQEWGQYWLKSMKFIEPTIEDADVACALLPVT